MSLHSSKEEVKARVFDLSFLAWEPQCYGNANHRAFIDNAKKKLSRIAIIDSLTGSMTYRIFLALSLVFSRNIKEILKKIVISPKPGSFAPNTECVGIILPASTVSSLCNFSILFASKM